MRKVTYILIFLISSHLLFPQSKTDSILEKLPNMPRDSVRVKAYFNLFWDNYRKNYKDALEYAIEAENLSRALELKFHLADALRVKSFALTGLGRTIEAQTELLKSLEIFTHLDDKKMIADVNKELGWLQKKQFNYEEAFTYFFKALNLAKKIHDYNSEAQIYSHIAGIYKIQKQYDKALKNYEMALALVKKLNIKPGISACLTNMASTYVEMKDFEKALFYHKQALQLKNEIGDKLGTARVLNNLGIVYNELDSFGLAETHFSNALPLAKEIGDKNLISTIQYGQSVTAFEREDYGKSIRLARHIVAEQDSFGNLDLVIKLHKRLFLAYTKVGNFERANTHALEWQDLSDSLYNGKILEVTNELEAKYQNVRKTKEIALLTSEKELQTLQLTKRQNERNTIIVFAILAITMAILVYNQYRIKKRSNRELQELDQAKSNFFANISHEFRTPLTLIKGPIEHVEQNPEEQLDKNHIKMIRRNTNRLLALVNQLLDLSKIDQKRLQLKITEGDIFKCLRAAAASFNSLAAQRHIEFRVDIPTGFLWAAFDRDKVEKIVYNLLGNAFKFSDDEEMISIKAVFVDGELRIEVSDTGRGISKESLPFVFDRFYQADNTTTKEKEGSGIGLALSRDLVELMDGTLTVSSELGKGSFFTVHLPMGEIKTTQPKEKVGQEGEKAEFSKTYDFEKSDQRNIPSVLLVEDNEDMRTFLIEHLSKQYRVIKAVNGQEGLKKATSKVPDLIITDLMMPKMDGIELSKELKSNIATSHIPVIMLTAKAGIENKIQGLETGADDYLTKPFDSRELLVRTSNLIDQRRKLRENFANEKIGLQPDKITVTSIDQRFLEQVLNLLEQQYTNSDFGVTDMQNDLGMSKSQFHRKMKALTNESPGELLRNFRLKRAAQLLAQDADTVTQIAYKVGFNDLSYFTKCFKALHGMLPSAYKQ